MILVFEHKPGESIYSARHKSTEVWKGKKLKKIQIFSREGIMTEKAHPSPLLEPIDPGGGGQGEGRRRAAEAEPRPWDAAARRGQEQQGEGEHAAGDGHAAGQDQQDVRHVGQVQGETSLSGVDLESM